MKILVAEGDAAHRRTLRAVLHQCRPDAVLHEAAKCSDALDSLRSGNFDCALFGERLKGGDGLNCLRKAGVTTPIIFLTDTDHDLQAARAGESGVTVTLKKSVLAPEVLDSHLQSVLLLRQSNLEARQSQKEIRQAQDELRLRDSAIAASPNGIIICDPNQTDCPIIYIYCNLTFTDITGYAREEAIGHNCRSLQGKDTDDHYPFAGWDGTRSNSHAVCRLS